MTERVRRTPRGDATLRHSRTAGLLRETARAPIDRL